MIKYGLELEAFLVDEKDAPNYKALVVPNTIPADDCGFLAEARGDAFGNIFDAVYSVMAKMAKIRFCLAKTSPNLTVCAVPLMPVDRRTKLAASRIYTKGLTKYGNIYGFEFHKNKPTEHTAGVHISVTDSVECSGVCSVDRQHEVRSSIVNRPIDFPRFIRYMDDKFAAEIKLAKRNPGFYELKSDGRVEYRSLPSGVDMDKVAEVISKFVW